MGEHTQIATDANFAELIGSDTPALVDFWADWCGPCKVMERPLEELASENAGKLSVLKLNADENQRTTIEHNVMGLPTMILFQGGVEKRRFVGPRTKAQLESELAGFIG